MELDLEKRYEKMPKVLDFILDDTFQTAFYGGLGNGKTDGACWKAILLALRHPNALGLIGRNTYPELRDSTIRSFFNVCPRELIAKHDKAENKITLRNGAEIIFRAFDDPDKVKSINLGWFIVDQLEEISEDMYLTLLGRLRHPEIRLAVGVGNPEPGWVKRRFKDQQGKAKDLMLYEATTMENPYLPPEYVENLIRNYPDFWVKRYVYGDWNTFEGQVFSEFKEAVNVVDPFEIPKTWKDVFVLDYGMRNPTAVLKVVADYDDNYFIVDEHYEAGQIISYHAQKIKDMGYEKGKMLYIDPSCNAKNREKNGVIVSIVDEYMDEGIFPVLANNEMAGLLRANQWFKDGRLKIFRNCFNTIKEVSELRWKKVKATWDKNLPETEEDKNNHTTDCLKYFANSRTKAAVAPKPDHYPMLQREKELQRVGGPRKQGDWYNG